jgi:hypothetical protein
MSLAPKTIAEQPAWLESFLLQKDEAGTLEVDGKVEDVMRSLDELLSYLGWRRIVAVRSASAVLVFRKPFQILRIHAASTGTEFAVRTRIDMEWVKMR